LQPPGDANATLLEESGLAHEDVRGFAFQSGTDVVNARHRLQGPHGDCEIMMLADELRENDSSARTIRALKEVARAAAPGSCATRPSRW